MPIFEYHCEGCGCDFEQLVFSNSEQVACPKCKGDKVSKLMSCFAHKAGGKFVPSTGGGGCTSCAGGTCSTCK